MIQKSIRKYILLGLCILVAYIPYTYANEEGADCIKPQCTNKSSWGGYVLNSGGTTTCGCGTPLCNCFQDQGFLCLTYAGIYLIGNEPDKTTGKCAPGTLDCRNCPSTTNAPTTNKPTTTPTPNDNKTTTPGKPSPGGNTPNNDVNNPTTINPASIPMDTTLAMWQIGLIIGSGVLMIIVIVCVLVSWRKACAASNDNANQGVQEDARFYRENYRSQTFQQTSQQTAYSRRSSMAQSVMDPRRIPPSSTDAPRRNTDAAPVASF